MGLSWLSSILILGLAAHPICAVLPVGRYNGNLMQVDPGGRNYLVGYYPAHPPLSRQELATLAWKAAQEKRDMLFQNRQLLNGRDPQAVAAWQEGNGNIYVATSGNSKSAEVHAEDNIVNASRSRYYARLEIFGGHVITYALSTGGRPAFIQACKFCDEDVLQIANAKDWFTEGIQPIAPQVLPGWAARWQNEHGEFDYINVYDSSRSTWVRPTQAVLAPLLPQGWVMHQDSQSLNYYYMDLFMNTQWTIPTQACLGGRPPGAPAPPGTPPSNQNHGANTGWRRSLFGRVTTPSSSNGCSVSGTKGVPMLVAHQPPSPKTGQGTEKASASPVIQDGEVERKPSIGRRPRL